MPASLAGTWSGRARQKGDTYTVRVKVTQGATSGTIRYTGTSFTCGGVLSLLSSSGGALTLHQVITEGVHICANGTVTLSPGGSGAVEFKFTGASGQSATGTLAKQ